MRPRHARPDCVQSEIVSDLRQLGFFVLDVSQLAHLGFDLLVCGYSRKMLGPEWLAVEVKSTKGSPLTEREAEVQAEMVQQFGENAPIIVAWSAEDVLRWYGAM